MKMSASGRVGSTSCTSSAFLNHAILLPRAQPVLEVQVPINGQQTVATRTQHPAHDRHNTQASPQDRCTNGPPDERRPQDPHPYGDTARPQATIEDRVHHAPPALLAGDGADESPDGLGSCHPPMLTPNCSSYPSRGPCPRVVQLPWFSTNRTKKKARAQETPRPGPLRRRRCPLFRHRLHRP